MSHPLLCPCSAQPPGLPPELVECTPEPRELEELFREADATQGRWVRVGGPDPAAHPELETVLRYLRDRGLRIRLEVDALSADRLAQLTGTGVDILTVRLASLAHERHDRWTGRPGSGQHTLATAEAASGLGLKLEVLTRLTRCLLPDLPELPAWCAALGAELQVESLRLPPRAPRRLATMVPSRRETREALESLRTAPGEVVLRGLAGPPAPPRPTSELPSIDRRLWTWLRDDIPLPAAVGGCLGLTSAPEAIADAAEAAGGLEDLALQLACWRCPPVDLPPSLGGLAAEPPSDGPWARADATPLPVWTPAPGRRVGVIDPPIHDVTMTLSTLPALARALTARGADVRWLSAWGALDEVRLVTSGAQRRAALDAAHGSRERFVASLDLAGLDLVVAPNWDIADEVLAHPTLDAHTRVVVADFHMLHGIDRWRDRFVPAGTHPAEVDWWPSDRVHVHACFPAYARLYGFNHVPQRQILWRPYPLDTTSFSPGPPPPDCDSIFAGGNQGRDWRGLTQAAERLSADGHPIRLYTRHAPPGTLPPPLRWMGTVDLSVFFERLSHSRFAVIPVAWSPNIAAGLTVITMALAAGRPVISTLTGGTLDHLRHGEDALLVPPGRPDLLAKAIERLDGDDALLRRLSEGALRAAKRISVKCWADELLMGARAERVVGRPGGPLSPW